MNRLLFYSAGDGDCHMTRLLFYSADGGDCHMTRLLFYSAYCFTLLTVVTAT